MIEIVQNCTGVELAVEPVNYSDYRGDYRSMDFLDIVDRIDYNASNF